MDTARAQKAIEAIALQNGISVTQVRAEITKAITEAMENTKNDPLAKKHWQSISRTNGVITPEELIAYIAGQIEKTAD